MQEDATQISEQTRGLAAQELLEQMLDRFGDRIALASSLSAEDQVVDRRERGGLVTDAVQQLHDGPHARGWRNRQRDRVRDHNPDCLGIADLEQIFLGKLEVDTDAIARDVGGSWEVLAEAVQTVMRRHGIPEPYERLKELTRGQAVTQAVLHEFIESLEIPAGDKQRLLLLTPAAYTGLAEELAEKV